MSEPLDMSKARNAYSGEREFFGRELQRVLNSYQNVPINFDIKQHLHFRAADLKAEALKNYRLATRSITNNQIPQTGNATRLRELSDSEETFHRRLLPAKLTGPIDPDLDVDEFLANRRRQRINPYTSGGTISTLTFDSHRNANTNTHVLAFERELIQDCDKMSRSIDLLTDDNRNDWLKTPKLDVTTYFTSKYDDATYLGTGYNTLTPGLGLNLRSSARDADFFSAGQGTEQQRFKNTISGDVNGLAHSRARDYFDRYMDKL